MSEEMTVAGPLTFDQYQAAAASTAIYPGAGTGSRDAIDYCLMGLVSEVGEIAGKYKKILRDKGGNFDAIALNSLGGETGDAIWYLGNLARELAAAYHRVDGVYEEDVEVEHFFETLALANLNKLFDRQSRGVLGGSGDNR